MSVNLLKHTVLGNCVLDQTRYRHLLSHVVWYCNCWLVSSVNLGWIFLLQCWESKSIQSSSHSSQQYVPVQETAQIIQRGKTLQKWQKREICKTKINTTSVQYSALIPVKSILRCGPWLVEGPALHFIIYLLQHLTIQHVFLMFSGQYTLSIFPCSVLTFNIGGQNEYVTMTQEPNIDVSLYLCGAPPSFWVCVVCFSVKNSESDGVCVCDGWHSSLSAVLVSGAGPCLKS